MLSCDGVSLEAAALEHGTPLFVYSRAAVEEAYRAYDRAFDRVPHRICYALKANGSHALLKILAGLGAGADIVSGGELRAALRAGFPAERIVFSGVGQERRRDRAGRRAGHRRVQRRGRGRDRADLRRRVGRGPDGAGVPARQPGHRRALPSVHLDRPARQQVRRGHRRRRGDPPPGAAPARDRDQRRPVPHRLPDHRPRPPAARGGRPGVALAHACWPRASRCAPSTSAAGSGSTTRATRLRRWTRSRPRCCRSSRGCRSPCCSSPAARWSPGRACSSPASWW